MPLDGVHRAVRGQVRDQELAGRPGWSAPCPAHPGCAAARAGARRSQWARPLRQGGRGPPGPACATPLRSSSPSSSVSWRTCLHDEAPAGCAYGMQRARQRVEVELTKPGHAVRAQHGDQHAAWRRPRELSGRVASFCDQSLRSIALPCRTHDQRRGRRLVQELLHQEVVVGVGEPAQRRPDR